jgi:hypothetical protein
MRVIGPTPGTTWLGSVCERRPNALYIAGPVEMVNRRGCQDAAGSVEPGA